MHRAATGGWRTVTRPAMHVTAATTASTVLIHLPVFLLGGLAVLIRSDIPTLDEARVGAAVSVFFGSSAVASIIGGRLSEARGPRVGMVAAAVLSSLALLLLATTRGLTGIYLAVALGGAANGAGQPASNLGLARGIRRRRQGFAFGIKQSSVPIASLLAGFSVPLIGVTLGWRWTFVVAALLVAGVIALVPRRFGPASRILPAAGGVASDAPRPVLLLLAVGAAFGSAAANSLGAFAVLSSVAYGLGTGTAGYLLALGSGAGVVSRVLTGWQADRRGQAHLPVVARMLATGSLAYALLAAGAFHPSVLVVGIVVAFAAGWGWPGLMAFAVVRLNPAAPGLASGVVLAGGTAGAVVGPLGFGLIARSGSYPTAWLAAAAFSAVGAMLVVVARRTLRTAIEAGRMTRPPVGGG